MRRKYLPTVSRLHLEHSARELIILTRIVQLSTPTSHLVASLRKAVDRCTTTSSLDAVGITVAWTFAITCHFKKQQVDWRDLGICSLISAIVGTRPAA
jgi:hypothetical protein